MSGSISGTDDREEMSALTRVNRKICRSWYEKAKHDKTASSRVLVRVIDLVSLLRFVSDFRIVPVL